MRKTIIKPVLAVLLGIVLLAAWYYRNNPLITKVTVNGHTFYADLAVTPQEKELGLGNRFSMPQDHGMLFIWDHKEVFPFWMKGMKFPIDILWIVDTTIVDITHSAPVVESGRYPIYHPPVPVNKVLEINAGLAKQYSITIGDTIRIK